MSIDLDKSRRKLVSFSLSAGCQEVDIDYYGDDINGCGIKTNSWQICSEECRKNSQCLYWTWLPNDFANVGRRTQCCLKDAKSGKTSYVGLISGSKQCGSLPGIISIFIY